MARNDDYSDLALRPGDIVRRRKGPVMHVGVVLDGGHVLHNTPDNGEHVSDLASFAAGRRVEVERLSTSERLRVLAAAGSDGSRGRRYHLLHNNCEHTLHRVRDGRPRSPQLIATAAGVLLAGAGLLLTRHWTGALPGLAVARRWGVQRT